MGLVSVIVTCYNHEKYIEQCLKSVLSQTYPEIELLVINDGSTDKSCLLYTSPSPRDCS